MNWEALARAETPPLRLRLLMAIEDAGRPVSPVELAKSLPAPLSNVAYHVRALNGSGLISLDHIEPRRGSVEHFYRGRRVSTSPAEALRDQEEFRHGREVELECPGCGECWLVHVPDFEDLTENQAECPACGAPGIEL